jgi:ribosomal protein L11 methylase PrmA
LNSSRHCAASLVFGGVFTETRGVYRESLCNDNFHVHSSGNFLIICVKKEFKFFKKRKLRGWLNYYLQIYERLLQHSEDDNQLFSVSKEENKKKMKLQMARTDWIQKEHDYYIFLNHGDVTYWMNWWEEKALDFSKVIFRLNATRSFFLPLGQRCTVMRTKLIVSHMKWA